MNTSQEIRQVMEDYQIGKMGRLSQEMRRLWKSDQDLGCAFQFGFLPWPGWWISALGFRNSKADVKHDRDRG